MNGASDSSIAYDELVQKALKSVVAQVLTDAGQFGLPGDHHFYIAFKTKAPGVNIPDRLREKYPDEMTIVLQHRFWNLRVHEDFFEVELSFNQRRERLVIPFAALIGFVDPSVRFALQFQEQDADAAASLPTARSQVPEGEEPSAEAGDDSGGDQSGNVVTLDNFRKRP